ncbi:hypothetical protein [Granulosicoccus antarcticus]|uniref:Uncharacterized protein n=1 Tax=Granulosicoccus antarcticus IMCC3135 TaxID=1192854 RepID=A0A2Z2NPX4_9GAMM|nr:hypothetical protein [Granulosicoccus antarcticus]ASJ71981.1 hypothetical protein IMCC3135_09420 [Granulosicoccus antarcticus IMCC3135]
MADKTEELLTGSVDEYLLSLAWSLQQAQRQLSQLSAPGPTGEFPVTYQIPEMEFELKMSLELRQSSVIDAAGGATAGAKVLRGTVLSGSSSDASKSLAASTIKGRFVAVPSRGGNPPPVLTVTMTRPGRTSVLGLAVRVSSVSGEPLADVPVHFNVDRDLTNRLNTLPASEESRPMAGVVRTNAEGVAVTEVEAAEKDFEKRIAIVIDALGKTETIVFKGGAS